MKRRILIISAFIMLILVFCSACSDASDHKNDNDYEPNASSTQSGNSWKDGSEGEVNDQGEHGGELSNVDLFSGLQVVFDGWNDTQITPRFITDSCDYHFSSISFSLDGDYPTIKNGDKVTVKVSYDENELRSRNCKPLRETCQYEVKGLTEIWEAKPFSNDVAWVKVYKLGADEYYGWACCDKQGEILFILEPGSEPTTPFCDGVAVIDHKKIINKQGEVLWDADTDGVEKGESIWGEGNIKEVSIQFTNNSSGVDDYFGYTVVNFSIESYELTAKKTGILDCNINWRLDPDNDYYISYYRGKGLYSGDGYDFDLFSNKAYDWYTDELKSVERKFITSRHDGLMYDYDQNGFVDSSGNVKIDLNKYNLYSFSNNLFNEGYALLDIKNDQGSSYIVVIDKTGKEMFTPQHWRHGELHYGYFWVDEEGYYDIYGQKAFDLEIINGKPFSDGMALVQSLNYKYHYIDTNGKIIF